jgi:hypothetical protein
LSLLLLLLLLDAADSAPPSPCDAFKVIREARRENKQDESFFRVEKRPKLYA